MSQQQQQQRRRQQRRQQHQHGGYAKDRQQQQQRQKLLKDAKTTTATTVVSKTPLPAGIRQALEARFNLTNYLRDVLPVEAVFTVSIDVVASELPIPGDGGELLHTWGLIVRGVDPLVSTYDGHPVGYNKHSHFVRNPLAGNVGQRQQRRRR